MCCRRHSVGILLLALTVTACGPRATTVEFYLGGGHRFSQAERRTIEAIADATAAEARRLLPTLPGKLVIRVYSGRDVIPETGERASAVPPATVIWVVDASRPGGVASVTRTWLRATLLHEFHHLVRSQTVSPVSLMDEAVTEGMATVFERDVAGVAPPWGTYPDDADQWLAELAALPPETDRAFWLRARHPDGRRWIGMKVGAYLVDQAAAASGRNAADLASASTQVIIGLASQPTQ